MSWIEAAILGIIQGLTEFLPISSTGHLYLGRHLFGLDEAGLFLDTMLHFGTLLAVLTVYWREILHMIRKPWSRISLLVLVGTIPTVIIGLTFKDYFEEISQTGVTIGWEFLVTGVVLWASDTIKHQGYKTVDQIRYSDAFLIGVFQGAAIMPALSRSGLTIAAALFRKIDKAAAAYFSFLLSIPSIAGAVVYQGKKLLDGGAEMLPLSALLLGTLLSAVLGYIAVKWMISILQRGSLKGFAVYVWILGAVVLGAQWLGYF
ncbi:undecaprenyl-diphosphate phosphatase [Paenactinomyces guangxiensis]|uniref:Undecaprenyl-diphosphatase n=1 Tax=Paenactinomyces guangxiensis TaxID=1490290 RepID=A0A7W1WPA1_9BACL|nr:undecaprenyl-diphosphate phosphatase [Paenactinomyces guangxiensis]MBA4493583.1 undecaprenyl-diphosphate phosphatase [Paenactinomyces guangxiensis]MBH8590870.1 undecaprenyl-diphosphate phosphatase [Paenactinomyces guangxiensis]